MIKSKHDLPLHEELFDILVRRAGLVMIPEWEWKRKTHKHPYQQNRTPGADKPVITCRASEDTLNGRWAVDAGTGEKFKGNFPMVPVMLRDPQGNQNLGAHLDLVEAVAQGFRSHLERGESVLTAYVVPMFVKAARYRIAILDQLWFYGAYTARFDLECHAFDPFTPYGMAFWNEEQTAKMGDHVSFTTDARRFYSLKNQDHANQIAREFAEIEVRKPVLDMNWREDVLSYVWLNREQRSNIPGTHECVARSGTFHSWDSQEEADRTAFEACQAAAQKDLDAAGE